MGKVELLCGRSLSSGGSPPLAPGPADAKRPSAIVPHSASGPGVLSTAPGGAEAAGKASGDGGGGAWPQAYGPALVAALGQLSALHAHVMSLSRGAVGAEDALLEVALEEVPEPPREKWGWLGKLLALVGGGGGGGADSNRRELLPVGRFGLVASFPAPPSDDGNGRRGGASPFRRVRAADKAGGTTGAGAAAYSPGGRVRAQPGDALGCMTGVDVVCVAAPLPRVSAAGGRGGERWLDVVGPLPPAIQQAATQAAVVAASGNAAGGAALPSGH